jgi:hypothetical protein
MKNLFNTIALAWSVETCYPPLRDKWSKALPELGQCAITALIVQERLGGIILFNRQYHHYWNLLPDSGEVDLTRGQFQGVERMQIDGYKDVSYFLQNEDTLNRYNILKSRILAHEMHKLQERKR